MSYLIPNRFSLYALTRDEEIQGSILTTAQKEFIQNQIALCAEEKIALEFNGSDPLLFAQQEAYKRGQIDAYEYLLDCSSVAQEEQLNPPDSSE